MTQNYINHIALVLDASYSMGGKEGVVVKVADDLIAHLAQRSKELDQETRITVYTFSDDVTCAIYDKDVLRLPSIKGFYELEGNTALIAATMKSQLDLEATAQLYGDHAFLTYVLTDGQENASIRSKVFGGPGKGSYTGTRTKFTLAEVVSKLSEKLNSLPDNWTVACLVPDASGIHEAKRFGFPADNIAVWDSTNKRGVEQVGNTIRQATENFMVSRASGVRGTRSLFSTSPDTLNQQSVKDANLIPLAINTYNVLDVTRDFAIREWVTICGYAYQVGKAFYQLTKTETIQPQKSVVVRNKNTNKFYAGPEARNLLGLTATSVRVKPDDNPDFEVFVQSTSVNRKLLAGTKVLLLK